MSTLDGDIQILNTNAFIGRNGHTPRVIVVHGKWKYRQFMGEET